MAQLNNTDLEGKFNNGTTGLFKTNITGAIGSDDARALVEDVTDSYLNIFDNTVWRDCGDVDLSADLFPTSGGTGAAGAILKNNTFDVTVEGTPGGALEPILVGCTIRALVDTPGQTLANWRIYY
jgi:hypothetical protein